MRDPGVGAAELLVEFRPGNDRRLAQRMQAVTEPDVDVDRGTAILNQANRPLLARHGMLDERLEEAFRQLRGLLPEPALARVAVDRRIDHRADDVLAGEAE